MPWEKDFDVDTAVGHAMNVFWAKGYEATSISDLVGAMQINKGSLYNAFGSKKALFIRALLKYELENHQAVLSELEAMDDPILAIKTLFDSAIAECEADTDRKGCLLVNTALEFPHHSKDIQDMVTAALKDIEGFFERTIKAAQACGQVPSKLDASESAKSLLGQMVGLLVLARGALDITSLCAIRTRALQQISA